MAQPTHFTYIVGSRPGSKRADEMTQKLNRLKHQVTAPDAMTVIRTEYAGHSIEIARAVVSRQRPEIREVVYILGGDGSAHELASVLAQTDVYMGVLPAGTGNDFARSLYGERPNIDLLLKNSLTPQTIDIDAYRINDDIGINVASFGYDTVVLEATHQLLEKYPKIGPFAYAGGVIKTFFSPKSTTTPIRWRWTDDTGATIDRTDFIAVGVIANSRFYGGGYMPAPQASLIDGYLDVMVAQKMSVFKFARLLLKYRKGKHLNHPYVSHYRVRQGRFESVDGSDILANSDGQIFYHPSIDFEVLPRAIHLVVPAGIPLPK